MLGQLTDHARTKLVSRLAGVALVAAGIGLTWSLHASGRNTLAIQADGALIERVEAVLSSMKDLETGERGFLMTGDDAFLQPYHDAEAELAQDTLPDDRDTSFAQLRRLVAIKRDAAKRVIEVRRTQGLEAAVSTVTPGDAESTMDAMRAQVADVKATLSGRIAGLRNGTGRRFLSTLAFRSS